MDPQTVARAANEKVDQIKGQFVDFRIPAGGFAIVATVAAVVTILFASASISVFRSPAWPGADNAMIISQVITVAAVVTAAAATVLAVSFAVGASRRTPPAALLLVTK